MSRRRRRHAPRHWSTLCILAQRGLSTRLRVDQAGEDPGPPLRRTYAARDHLGAGSTDHGPTTAFGAQIAALIQSHPDTPGVRLLGDRGSKRSHRDAPPAPQGAAGRGRNHRDALLPGLTSGLARWFQASVPGRPVRVHPHEHGGPGESGAPRAEAGAGPSLAEHEGPPVAAHRPVGAGGHPTNRAGAYRGPQRSARNKPARDKRQVRGMIPSRGGRVTGRHGHLSRDQGSSRSVVPGRPLRQPPSAGSGAPVVRPLRPRMGRGPGGISIQSWPIAHTTACVRSLTESFRRMELVWFLTVCSLIVSA